jgi:hypothetical protein
MARLVQEGMLMALYGPLSPTESVALYKPTGKTVDYEQFCAAHPYRVVGPEDLPERRFSTLTSAAITVVSAGPGFHVECGDFQASYTECRFIDRNAVAAAQLKRLGGSFTIGRRSEPRNERPL